MITLPLRFELEGIFKEKEIEGGKGKKPSTVKTFIQIRFPSGQVVVADIRALDLLAVETTIDRVPDKDGNVNAITKFIREVRGQPKVIATWKTKGPIEGDPDQVPDDVVRQT